MSLCICCQICILVQGGANTRAKHSLVALVGHQLVLLSLELWPEIFSCKLLAERISSCCFVHCVHSLAQFVGIQRLETETTSSIISLCGLAFGNGQLIVLDGALRIDNDFAICKFLPITLIDRTVSHHLLIELLLLLINVSLNLNIDQAARTFMLRFLFCLVSALCLDLAAT